MLRSDKKFSLLKFLKDMYVIDVWPFDSHLDGLNDQVQLVS